jgi:hypothetical protein
VPAVVTARIAAAKAGFLLPFSGKLTEKTGRVKVDDFIKTVYV